MGLFIEKFPPRLKSQDELWLPSGLQLDLNLNLFDLRVCVDLGVNIDQVIDLVVYWVTTLAVELNRGVDHQLGFDLGKIRQLLGFHLKVDLGLDLEVDWGPLTMP